MNSKTQTIPNVNNEKELFLNINQQAFIELLTFIDFADERLNIGFVEVKFSQDRDILINALLEHPNCNNIQFEVLDFSNPNLRFLRDELVTALKQINIQPNKKLILLITGLEKSIGIVEEYPSVLTNLNFVRDDLRTSIPHPILLFLPDYALTRLAKYAPDFWAWGRNVFTFKTNRSNLMTNSNNIVYSDGIIINLDLPEKQARIEQLLNLLNEYNTYTEEKTKNDLLTISNIYNQLGNAYDTLGKYQKAIIFYEQGLQISIKIRDKQGEGNSLRGLGNVYYSLGQYQKAITFHQQSLDISKEISDRQAQGISLGNLGNVYYSLGQYQKAITFHQQSLDISKEISDRQAQGISLGNLG
ncbi:MAG: tetratricopeptide repeat protein, partial [Crocosphaera sp.]|nr:tetratricopeptide repeat protein [Crocosphaera sp.]